MNALPEFWAALLGWLDLIAGRKDGAKKFNLSRRGLINATACYFAIVLLSLAVAALAGQNPGLIGVLVSLAFNALPLLMVWLVIGATYAMALLLIVRLPLELGAPGTFANALLGALCFMLYRGARGVAQLGIGTSLAFAVLCGVALVLTQVALYMLATGGQGI